MKVSMIINDLMNIEGDTRITDIATNNEFGQKYEIQPHLFSIQNYFKLPQIIKKEIAD